MGGQVLFHSEEIYFGDNIPADVKHVLLEATRVYPDLAATEALLEKAHDMAPRQLEVYYARYKFYFYNKRLELAEKVARQGLKEAALQAGFDEDWTSLDQDATNWSQPDDTVRFYLYTLKALGFILMRQERFSESESVLKNLARLDQLDHVGGSVVKDILSGIQESADAA